MELVLSPTDREGEGRGERRGEGKARREFRGASRAVPHVWVEWYPICRSTRQDLCKSRERTRGTGSATTRWRRAVLKKRIDPQNWFYPAEFCPLLPAASERARAHVYERIYGASRYAVIYRFLCPPYVLCFMDRPLCYPRERVKGSRANTRACLMPIFAAREYACADETTTRCACESPVRNARRVLTGAL